MFLPLPHETEQGDHSLQLVTLHLSESVPSGHVFSTPRQRSDSIRGVLGHDLVRVPRLKNRR